MKLEDEIERLRSKMMQEANERGSFIHENVVAISQQLDEILVRYQKMRQKHRRVVRFIGRFRMPSRPKSFRQRPPIIFIATISGSVPSKAEDAVMAK